MNLNIRFSITTADGFALFPIPGIRGIGTLIRGIPQMIVHFCFQHGLYCPAEPPMILYFIIESLFYRLFFTGSFVFNYASIISFKSSSILVNISLSSITGITFCVPYFNIHSSSSLINVKQQPSTSLFFSYTSKSTLQQTT